MEKSLPGGEQLMGFLNKINIFKRKEKNNDPLSYEENLDMLFGEKIREETIENIQEEELLNDREQKLQYVERCCDQMVSCLKHMENAKKEYKEVNDYLGDINVLENVPEDIKKELDYYAKRVVVLGNEKTGFKKYTSSIPEKVFVTMQTREKEIPSVIKSMAEDEEFCENAKADLTRLEGEKLSLKYDRRNYCSYVNAMRNITIIGLFAVIAAAVYLMYAYFQNESQQSGMNLLIISIVAAVFVTIVFIVNRNLLYRLKVIEIKLNRLIGLSNTIKLKYVNVRVKLDYEYNIYQVRSAFEMNNRYKSYLKAKKEQQAFAKTADKLYHSMNSYNDILKKIKLHDYDVWNTQVSAVINPKEMWEIKNMLMERRKKLKETIDYNKEIIDNTKEKIKKISMEDKECAGQILGIISKYEELA